MKSNILFIQLILLLLIVSCSKPLRYTNQSFNQLEEAKLEVFSELERSILKLTCSAYYENYYYSPPLRFDGNIPQDSLFEEKIFTTNSVAGTGLILAQRGDKMIILTCQHVFDFEDTLKTYYLTENRQVTNYLQTLSKKYGQTIYVSHKNGTISTGRIIIQDEESDIALIETQAIENVLSEFPFQGILNVPSKIKLGQEVYILGFPKGHFLITKGLASPSKYRDKFIVDVPFNRGFSGGVAITFDHKAGNYRYIGMANATTYDSEIVLTPSDAISNIDILKASPYEGDVYVSEIKLINHGITFVLRNDAIIEFMEKNESKLIQFGFSNIINLMK